jgi:hypothetical protein
VTRAARVLVPCGIAVILCAQPLAARPLPGSAYVRGSFGLATQALHDWRRPIDFQKAAIQQQYGQDWDNIGMAIGPGFEFGFMMTELLSVGMSVSRQKGVSDNIFSPTFSSSYEQKIEISAIVLTANATAWPAGIEGLFVSAHAGMAFGKARHEEHSHDVTAPWTDYDFVGAWDGSGLVTGVSVGWEEPIGPSGFGFVRGGYMYAPLGVFEGGSSSPQFGDETGPPRGAGGEPLETNISGFGLSAGFGVRFGARDEPDVPAGGRQGARWR